MRQRTEFSEMPPAFSVSREGGMAVIRFYTDIQKVDRDGETAYTAISWSAAFPWAESLQARVEANPERWLNAIKESSTAEAAAELRAKRDALLAESDSQVALDRIGLEAPMGNTFASWLTFLNVLASTLSGKWAVYRQALRDLPQQEGFPFDVSWPEKPND